MIAFKFNSSEVLNSEKRLQLQDILVRNAKMDDYLKNDLYALLDGVYYVGIAEQIENADNIGIVTKRNLHSILGFILRNAK